MLKNNEKYSCADCLVGECLKNTSDMTKAPDFCLTKRLTEKKKREVVEKYSELDNIKFMKAASDVELLGRITRVEETIQVAKKLQVKKIGIATCTGLLKEAYMAAKIFRAHGFEVYSVSCKCGTVRKTEIGLPEESEKIVKNICNPVLQANILNEQKTELNVAIGLCVGHDCLFNKYSEAPVTTMITKDKALCHNPVAALYTSDSMFKYLLNPEFNH